MRRTAAATRNEGFFQLDVDTLALVIFACLFIALLVKLLSPPSAAGATTQAGTETQVGTQAGTGSALDTVAAAVTKEDGKEKASAWWWELFLQDNPFFPIAALAITGFLNSALFGGAAASTKVGAVIGKITDPNSRVRLISYLVIDVFLLGIFILPGGPDGEVNWIAFAVWFLFFVGGIFLRVKWAGEVFRRVERNRSPEGEVFTEKAKRLVLDAEKNNLVDHLSFYLGKMEFLVRLKSLPFIDRYIEADMTMLKKRIAETKGYIDGIRRLPPFEAPDHKNYVEDFLKKNQSASDATHTVIAVNSLYSELPKSFNYAFIK